MKMPRVLRVFRSAPICVTTEREWAIYENGYITFGMLPNFEDDSSERLSHYVAWDRGETFPRTEEEIVEVMARAIR